VEEISEKDCEILSKKIKDNVFIPVNSQKTKIFLCGANISDKTKMRFKVAQELGRYWYPFDIIYPEDIFDELLYSSKSKDLLSLEHLLAESVDAIIVIPESAGSIAELGVFSNDFDLRKKLICLVDVKYKKDKSFINQGPIKLIKKENSNAVIFFDPMDITSAIQDLIPLLKKLKKSSLLVSSKLSLLQLDNFLLQTIFILEPISKNVLTSITGFATEDKKNNFQSATTALTILAKRRLIELTSLGYRLTPLGINQFRNLRKTIRKKNTANSIQIDNLRLEFFNLINRKKKLKE
jgi:hypothetical protein